MASFTVRVELHRADSEDYENLHEKMGEKGYSREITGSNGKKYKLPDAEYVAIKNMAEVDVVNEVKGIAEKVKSAPSILVTKSEGRAWSLNPI
ncbi:hypothetical protein [Serratia rubidaea]|uniref:hypothetical protein n=1 Tax=Serratia rubidaea TaxID=61652 RepID=UPI001BB0D7B8|nr:hypothetical protein [Serratia rubidaea]MBS0971889.1 hypothetical protein [Serratia rubidaea]MDC6111322.1 hypothetical protein [Serratia rubidaea]